MEKLDPSGEELFEKIRALEDRLWEAEETIRAIRNGEVDALVIHKAEGDQLYTLTGADHGYRVLVESISEGALILSSDDSIYYCNPALAEMLGLSIQKITGKKLDSHVAPEDLAQLSRLIKESRGSGAARGGILMKKSDGTLLPVNISFDNLRIEGFQGVCAVLTDLSKQKRIEEELRRHRTELESLVGERTADLARMNAEFQEQIAERRKAEQELFETHQRLRALMNALPVGVSFSDDPTCREITGNPSVLAQFEAGPRDNLSPSAADPDAPGRKVRFFRDGREIGDAELPLQRAVAEGRAIEPMVLEVLLPSGRRWITEASGSPIRDAEGKVTGGVAVTLDITERKRMEDELRKSRDELEIRVAERTAELVEVNQDLMAEIEERQRAEALVNAERRRFYDVLETLPLCLCLLTPDYHVLFANRIFRESFGEINGRCCYELIFGLSGPCAFCESFKVLQTNEPHHWERVLPDGRVNDVHDFPFTDTDGSSLILEMSIDITERRQAEEKISAYTARLELMNRELADFAFIASHDLQEPLRKIQTFGQMLNKRYSDALGTVGRDFMDRMIRAASRMSDLIRALLEYSRTGTSLLNYMPVSVSEVARQAVSDLEFLIHKARGDIKIDEMPAIEADGALLRQLFQNMIENAIKYRKDSERPTVKIHGMAAGPVCHIFIEDNGIGLDECYRHEIFKPFERLHGRHSPYSGTGMGLAICKKIAVRHGGDITVNSKPGQGATFIVTLPIKQKKRDLVKEISAGG
jgi:PAS domain S-box-containing protein